MAELRQMVEMVEPIKQKTPEEKEYLICIKYGDGTDQWDIVNGRTEAYNYIKQYAELIDFDESFILVETTQLSKRKSIYHFMKYAEQFYPEDSFDIDDYIVGDIDAEEDEEVAQDTDVDSVFAASTDRLSMEAMLNKEVTTTNIVEK